MRFRAVTGRTVTLSSTTTSSGRSGVLVCLRGFPVFNGNARMRVRVRVPGILHMVKDPVVRMPRKGTGHGDLVPVAKRVRPLALDRVYAPFGFTFPVNSQLFPRSFSRVAVASSRSPSEAPRYSTSPAVTITRPCALGTFQPRGMSSISERRLRKSLFGNLRSLRPMRPADGQFAWAVRRSPARLPNTLYL
jgi:hypothetical protein